MAQATHIPESTGMILLALSFEEAQRVSKIITHAAAYNPVTAGVKAALDKALRADEPTFRVVTPPAPAKMPRLYSRVRMLKDCGRWITPGEEGVITYIDFDSVNPESDTLFTVVFEPGRYQTMTRECFEVL